MTNADTVYASPTSLYVATNGGWERNDTSIHRFDLDGADRTVYRASGQVPGDLLNQFSLSEYKGVLRVATTEGLSAQSQSHVTALRDARGTAREDRPGQRAGRRRADLRGALHRRPRLRRDVPPGRPALHARPRRPAHPRVRGELKILGYSAYLHPVGTHELLGIGQDASAEGARQGTQLSLFDVADPASRSCCTRSRSASFTSSEAEYDHHAFLWWEPLRLAVVPVSGYEGASTRGDRASTSTARNGIVEDGPQRARTASCCAR